MYRKERLTQTNKHTPSHKPLASRPLHFRARRIDLHRMESRRIDLHRVESRRIDLHRVESSRKKCKTAILFYCFHTAGELHTFVLALYNLLGSETSFNRKNFHQNYLFFSKSLFWQPVMHFRVHFIISFTLHSWVPFSVKEFFNGYVNRSYCIIVMYCV